MTERHSNQPGTHRCADRLIPFASCSVRCASAVLFFPTSLHSVRRADLHHTAEAGGLHHASVGRGSNRRLVVWGAAGLDSSMLLALCAALGAGSSRPVAPEWALQPPTCHLWAAGMAAAATLQDAAGSEGLLEVLAIDST